MYCGYITTLKGLRKHSNADRLQCVEVFGQNVIVDLSYKDGQRLYSFRLMDSFLKSMQMTTNL